jgi:hypothetical protein
MKIKTFSSNNMLTLFSFPPMLQVKEAAGACAKL